MMPPPSLEPLVVLTGAGISAESGVPTFRGPQGLWRTHRPQDLANPAAFARDPDLIWEFYRWRRKLIGDCAPNAAHKSLVEIENAVSNFTLITQNIDGLHQAAGSRQVIELHGSVWGMLCSNCQARWTDHRVELPPGLPRCERCGGLARPDVVWFGETLDPMTLDRAGQASRLASVMLIIGTSAIVQPAAQLPLMAYHAGAHLVEINPETTPLSPYVHQSLHVPATVGISQWWDSAKPSK
ncbi:MAG: NAD-dependent deacylase [Anaerolineales bacterium]|jgi:NAD-dependent deacetylase